MVSTMTTNKTKYQGQAPAMKNDRAKRQIYFIRHSI